VLTFPVETMALLTRDGDRVYGRGTSDDKGAVVASMIAMKVLKDMNVPLTKRIRLILGTNEETGSKCLAHYVEKEGHIDMGFTPDGKFQYLDCRMFSDGGPYECESYGTLMTGALMSGGPYIIPNVKVEGSAIRNNNLQGGAFRGYGINQAAISIETAMDMMAEKLGIDPFELRRRNAVYPGATSVGGEVLKYSMGMMDTINQCEKSLRKALKEYEGQYPTGSKVLGWGMASGFKNVGVGKGIFTDDGACRLILQGDGRLHMIVSGTEYCTFTSSISGVVPRSVSRCEMNSITRRLCRLSSTGTRMRMWHVL